MNEQIRHANLLKLLEQKGILSVPELVDFLKVSPATVRRDITKLSTEGKLKKIRNGIETISYFFNETQSNKLKKIDNLKISNLDEKTRIANKAATLCKDGESVILTCGTTMMVLGRTLCKRNLQVITNFLPLANYLIENDHESVVITGGQYNKNQAITLYSNNLNDAFYADIVFTSGKGLTTQGLYKTDVLIANSEQQILPKTSKLVVLLDSSKLDKAVGMLFTELKNISLLITGKEANPHIINKLRASGLNIILA
ncbi:DeoR family transcriptional regulator [Bisgaardia hudsonensis]|uniref:DeoR family transcriptional regulator n=1 Tax=Bisgaardia hudsonensis TaxID=109472 RepID=A0A4R2MX97_9PAST|nr:HTH-type transcriptional regulator UlaR [Bisgaardia hudsonensis]QLB12160.1 transcriptional regulator [Bisgaardia hudsonensis]TCP12197.1 DeoR family transcriptional regulator [Bisgaardia hudsonensis]